MQRILIRGGKSPFAPISYEETLARNVLGTNSGNLIFAESVWKTLSTKGTVIEKNGYSANPEHADKINTEYDVLVLPFANAFRKSFIPILRKFTQLIEQLDLPVVVTGVGAQAGIDASPEDIKAMAPDVTAFCKAVLDRSTSIGVRGEFTYDFIRSLGFSDAQVDIIGCPSMFYFGADLPQINKSDKLLKTSKVSMNVSPYVPNIEKLFETNYDHYDHLVYVPQNNESLDQILWDATWLTKFGKVFPKSTDHAMFRDDRLRMFIDTRTWMDFLSNYDFVFGTRIHGNIMALLAGTPGFVLAHDSRTLELARYFEIPHRMMDTVATDTLAEELFAEANYGPMLAGHGARFSKWLAFLEKNGLRHIYQKGEDGGAAFRDELAKTTFPSAMPTLPHQGADHLKQRMVWQNQETRKRFTLMGKRIKAIETEASPK